MVLNWSSMATHWVAARCATEAFSNTCAVHIEDCGCPAVVAQWQSTGGSSQRCPGFDSWRLLAFSHFPLFLLHTIKFPLFHLEARCSVQSGGYAWLPQTRIVVSLCIWSGCQSTTISLSSSLGTDYWLLCTFYVLLMSCENISNGT